MSSKIQRRDVCMINDFINVDDDPINNMLCKMTIRQYASNAQVQTFTNPLQALAHLSEHYQHQNAPNTLLLLDINMPELSGWQFLEVFAQLNPCIKERIKICILSSSIDPRDKQQAACNPHVFEYIEKPLSVEAIKQVMQKLFTKESLRQNI